MTWGTFTQLFQGKLIGDAIRNLRQTEFDNLAQRSLGVLEYEHEFDYLVRYVSQYHSMKEQKARQFIQGLWPEIWKALRPLGITSYHEATQKAQLVEQEETDNNWDATFRL